MWPERSHTGSCNASSGSSTFGSPSSEPLYMNTVPGSASITSAMARARH
ncbi:Uncharacterised protein [Mycobacteroides abscessus subsp. abscessus]|nr:Uncharacterised protein [Mycobacteroides abscessus subsp. abscessus]